MAYTAGFSVSVGDPTKASDVTTLAANDDFLKTAIDKIMVDSATPTFALVNGVTATTQSSGNNSTKLATTAYADAASLSFANDANNRVVTGTGSGLNGEADLTFDGSVLAVTGAVTMANAAGPTIVNEAATATNPTLIPNKAEVDTGYGWAAADTLTAITGGAERMRIDGTGAITTPNNPAFFNRYGGTASNATGDDTQVTLIGNTEVYDRNSDHNASTGGFTAPVAGLYQMSAGIYFEGLLSTHTRTNLLIISTNSGGARSGYINPWNMTAQHSWGNVFSYSYSLLMNLAAGDVVLAKVSVGGGTKVVDLQGSTNVTNYFSGYLVG